MYCMRFELNHLKYFYFTVVEGGVTSAATKLCVQQPVVSKMLKILEEDLGRPLFLTVGRKKELTDFGQKIFRHCESIFQETAFIESLTNQKSIAPKIISVGGAEHLLNFIVKSENIQLFEKNKVSSVVLNACSYSEMLKNLEDGQLDFGLCLHMPYASEKIEVLKEYEMRHRLVVHCDYRMNKEVLNSFIGSREVDDRRVRKFPALSFHREKYPKCKIHHSSNSLSIHKELVRKGLGVSILPDFLVREELESGEFIDLYPRRKFNWNLKILINKNIAVKDFMMEILSFN